MPPDETPDGPAPDDATRLFRPPAPSPALFPDDDDEWARPLGPPPSTPPPSTPPPSTPPSAPASDAPANDAPDPFRPATPPAENPFAPAPRDPFAMPPDAPAAEPDPFRPAPPPPDPFAPPVPAADPFAALRDTPAAVTPSAPTAPDPFAPAPPAGDPFAATPTAPAADPFAPTAPADPFAPPPADPFAPAAPRVAPLAAPPAVDDPFAPRVPTPAPFAARPPADPFDSAVRHPVAADPFAASPMAPVAAAAPAVRLAVDSDRLAGAFASVFALILHLRTSLDFGDAAALRSRAEGLIDQAVAAARASGADGTAVRDAEFAVVAFFDETILTSEWAGRDAWAAQPLQLSRYNRYDAGEAFFERLRVLLAEGASDQVLEVYYLCLALGYKGRYQIHGREVLGQLVDDLGARLARAPGGALTAIAPHGRPSGPAAVATRSGLPTWALFVGAAVLVGLLYLILSLSVSGVAREVADDVRALPAAP